MSNVNIQGLIAHGTHAGRTTYENQEFCLYFCDTHGPEYWSGTFNGISWSGAWSPVTGAPASSVVASQVGFTPGGTVSATDVQAALTEIDSEKVPFTVVDAKGDLLVGSADNAIARLGVGTDAYVLTADSTAPLGVKWAAASGGGGGGSSVFSGVRAYRTAALVGTGGTAVVTFDAERFDTDAYHDNSTNTSRFTIPVSGYYDFGYLGGSGANGPAAYTAYYYRVNGGSWQNFGDMGSGHQYVGWGFSASTGPRYYSAGDYIELGYIADSGTTAANAGLEAWLLREASPGTIVGASSLLARTSYNPGSQATYSTGSSTMSLVDSTNLSVTFTMPASGEVIVILEAHADITSGTAQGQWALDDGNGTVAGTTKVVTRDPNGDRVTTRMRVTGTPGSTKTLRWAYASIVAGSTRIIAGGNFGEALMEVMAAGVVTFTPGAILSVAEKTDQITSSTSSTSDGDVDATNLACTFTVPPSGNVLVTQSAVGDALTSTSPGIWTVRQGTTTLKQRTMGNAYTSLYAEHRITGLTPGATVTLKWGFKSLTGGVIDIYSGGASGTQGNPIMKVIAL